MNCYNMRIKGIEYSTIPLTEQQAKDLRLESTITTVHPHTKNRGEFTYKVNTIETIETKVLVSKTFIVVPIDEWLRVYYYGA